MLSSYTPPKNLREMLDYIKETIRRMDNGELWRGDAAGNIVGATLCNNTCECEQFYEQYPDLETLVELAADLETEDEIPEANPYPGRSSRALSDAWAEAGWHELRTLLAKLDKIVP